MGTSVADLRRWFKEGKAEGATHMIVVCDTFDWSDYPVYVKPGEDTKEKVSEHDKKEMQKVMEVYNLSKPMEEQLKPGKLSFNY